MALSPETTLAIVLGASEFPESPELGGNPTFARSAAEFEKYLLEKNEFSLPRENLLTLFESDDSTADQDRAIENFLKSRIKQLEQSKLPASDLLVYYVGHGGFCNPGDQYFLALRGTAEGREQVTGYPIELLANRLRETAAKLRRYLILDCCFSARAYEAFQSGPLEVARQKMTEELPPRGTALLCASGPRDPAKAPPNETYTMFSGALLQVLREGDTDLPARLSLHEVGERVRQLIKERFPDKAVRPQVMSPDESTGDLSTLPLFPNLGLDVKSLASSIARIERAVSTLATAQERSIEEFARFRDRISSMEAAMKDNAANSAASMSHHREFDPAIAMKYPWVVSSGLSRDEWDSLPGSVKSEIGYHFNRRFNAMHWLKISLLVAAATWSVLIAVLADATNHYPALLFRTYNRTIGQQVKLPEPSIRDSTFYALVNMSHVLTLLCGIISLVGLMALLQANKKERANSEKPHPSEPWDHFDLVAEARSQRWCELAGMEIERNAFSRGFIVYAITFLGTLVLKILLLFT